MKMRGRRGTNSINNYETIVEYKVEAQRTDEGTVKHHFIFKTSITATFTLTQTRCTCIDTKTLYRS